MNCSAKPVSVASLAGRLCVHWRTSHAQVRRVYIYVDGRLFDSITPAAGALACEIDLGPKCGREVRVTASYDGGPVRLSIGPAASSAAPGSVAAAFAAREQAVKNDQSALRSQRELFLELDRQTHPDLLPLLNLTPGEREIRTRAIQKMIPWLWRRSLSRAAARSCGVDSLPTRWPEFAADVAYLSHLLHGLLARYDTILPDAFESFANGELLLSVASPDGGPDGAYYSSFAGFALLVMDQRTTLPALEVSFFEKHLATFVGTLEIFAANYRAPKSARGGRYLDFGLQFFTKPLLRSADKLAMRNRFTVMLTARLNEEFDKWVLAALPEDVNDLCV